MYVENPKKRMKNHGFLLCSALYYMERRDNSYTIRVFFFQRETIRVTSSFKGRPCFLPSYLINFLLSSQDIYSGSYLQILAACSSYNLRNMAEYKDRCQVIIFLFLHISTAGVLFGDWRRRNAPTWHCGMWVDDSATTWGTTLGP